MEIDPLVAVPAIGMAMTAAFNTERRLHQSPQWRDRLMGLGEVPSLRAVGLSGLIVFVGFVAAIASAIVIARWWAAAVIAIGWVGAILPAMLFSKWTLAHPLSKFWALFAVVSGMAVLNLAIVVP
ncbi:MULTISPECIES: hypothetical protein [unclassified Sphingomonas]|uniref:hypothetical protein n=1 Tax=unclassified Sphingomonas TaxID=196159 RepID=UPI0012E188F7|nr:MULTISPECIES: hypothetical protein [unclassified Sphingomonas]